MENFRHYEPSIANPLPAQSSRNSRDSSNSTNSNSLRGSRYNSRQQKRLSYLKNSTIDFNALNIDSSEESDWDTESELEKAPIQEASRVVRRIPSVRKTNSNRSIRREVEPDFINSNMNTNTSSNSPYYCEEICPQLDLGYQWPRVNHAEIQRLNGFVKVFPENQASRQKELERNLLSRIKQDKRLLLSMTVNVKDTFARKSNFAFDANKIPKRILTKPSKPYKNGDNENCDYILKVNEILNDEPDYQYRVIDLLGQGTFGQVVKCERISTGELFSVKVIKNKTAYKTQSYMEIEILKKLNKELDPDDKHHILRLKQVFTHKNHLCLVFELLSFNLYDLIGHNRYKGFPLQTVRAFSVQILDTLCLLKEAKIIHCDLKPENILLESEKSLTIKVIDFGSACHEGNRIYSYIQSRFYRSPEILLGMRTYTGAIDMWSFGCIVAELFLGLPLFPGSSEYNQLFRIIEMLGVPPKDMLVGGRNTDTFFNKNALGVNSSVFELKSREQYNQENNKSELPRKKYFPQTALQDIVLQFNKGKPVLTKEEERKRFSAPSYKEKEEEEIRKETVARLCLLDFLSGILELNPLKRWTPQQALQHPFITQKVFTGPFKPDAPAKIKHVGRPVHSVRKRAESMGQPTAPNQLKQIAEQIQSPIPKYPKEQQGSITAPQPVISIAGSHRLRHTKSQGNNLGQLPPETNANRKILKYSNKVKVRNGSHDTTWTSSKDGQLIRDSSSISSNNNSQKAGILGTRKHYAAGEAAGGLLMMRQEPEKKDVAPAPSTTGNVSTTKRSMVDAIMRRK